MDLEEQLAKAFRAGVSVGRALERVDRAEGCPFYVAPKLEPCPIPKAKAPGRRYSVDRTPLYAEIRRTLAATGEPITVKVLANSLAGFHAYPAIKNAVCRMVERRQLRRVRRGVYELPRKK